MSKTSEEILDLSKPIPHMCSFIDGRIKDTRRTLESIQDDIESQAHKLTCSCEDPDIDIDDLLSAISDIKDAAREIEGYLEEYRSNFEELRIWGQDWKSKAKEYLGIIRAIDDLVEPPTSEAEGVTLEKESSNA